MPVYHAPLLQIDPKETRRYAGLMNAKEFDEQMILDACEDGLLLAEPRGIWTLYDYDCAAQTVAAEPPFTIVGKKIGAHLAGCDKVILLSATVGEAIEDEVTARFARGEYVSSVLLDAAATTAVEQIADGMEKAIAPQMARAGYGMRWRFSPGYGDWPLDQQPEMIRVCHCKDIGVGLSDSSMLVPRKSITAIIGLYKVEAGKEEHATVKGCAACPKTDCPSRVTKTNG